MTNDEQIAKMQQDLRRQIARAEEAIDPKSVVGALRSATWALEQLAELHGTTFTPGLPDVIARCHEALGDR